MEYNGFPSWNSWNVSLWINNEESLYAEAINLVKQYGRKKAARKLLQQLSGTYTPDGARYNYRSIYLALDDR